MVRLFTSLAFLASFAIWSWFEFGPAELDEGVQDILFWTGMLALFLNLSARPHKEG